MANGLQPGGPDQAADETGTGRVPALATDAVLKASAPMPNDAKTVEGIDFGQYANRKITAEELVAGMSRVGFQATAMGEAVRIINDMVWPLHRQLVHRRS